MRLIGLEGIETRLTQAWQSGQFPHAWLFSGPQGIGKASMARKFCARLGGSPIFTLQREVNTKTGRLTRDINVDQLRSLKSFLQLSSPDQAPRLVMIDAAEDMNKSAANAILKMLEEPPRGVYFFLISHDVGRIMPTILSRCHLLKFRVIDDQALGMALQGLHPQLPPDDLELISFLAQGSMGRALSFVKNADLARDIRAVLESLPKLDGVKALKLAQSLGAEEDRQQMFQDVLLGYLRFIACAGVGSARPSPQRELILAQRLSPHQSTAQKWAELVPKLEHDFHERDLINLDLTQLVMNGFVACEAISRTIKNGA
jgi:DNA polymerase-3 subunit delta'